MARRTPSKPSPSLPALSSQDAALLRRLDAALSEDEIRRILASALRGLSDAARTDLLARLPPETAATLTTVLSPPRRATAATKPAVPVASRGKLRQEWDRLWQQWEAVVEETGDEKGKYIQQDKNWSPPYVDTTSVSHDLDVIAAKMLPLIPRIIAEGVAPTFSFAEAIRELNKDLFAGLPDWIDPRAGDGCALGPKATSCLLEWEWTVAQRDGRDGSAFLDDLQALESDLDSFALDGHTLETFAKPPR